MPRRAGERLTPVLRMALWAALAAAGLGSAVLTPAAGSTTGEAQYLGTYVWEERRRGFGGFSGLELSDDGTAFTALSDRIEIVSGRLKRDAAGVVTGVEARRPRFLRDAAGAPLRDLEADSEGLAIGPDGTVWISFEGTARVRRQGARGAPPVTLPGHPDFATMPLNHALEALAVDARGRLYAIPERPPPGQASFPVYRFRDGAWDIPFRLPVQDGFEVAGADIGPDGRLYVLERDFAGLAFRSRLLRVRLDGTGAEVLLTTATGTHDNLEGVAIWADAGGLRATLIADDNRRFFQRTEIVDYRLPD